jgi:hypothetical protein
MMKHSETRIPPKKPTKSGIKITTKNIPIGEPYKYLDYEITEEKVDRKKKKKGSKIKRKSKSCGCDK